MTLGASTQLLNDSSTILAGGALATTGASVDNQSKAVNAPIVSSGTAYNWGHWDSGCGNLFGGCDYSYDAYRAQGFTLSTPQTKYAGIAVKEQFQNNLKFGNSPQARTGGASAELQQALGQGKAVRIEQLMAAGGAGLSSMFQTHPEPDARYVIEGDARFIGYRNWLSSDYISARIALAPEVTQKRLGDGFYEQRLIREQIANLTGKRFLGDYTNDEAQYLALMDAGITYARTFNLRPGIALSATQVAQLTSDMVWLVETDITLPGGATQKALVPQVYAAVRSGDLAPTGALMGGDTVQLASAGSMTNNGTILGRTLVDIDAHTLANSGLIAAERINARASEDINNTGGTLQAQRNINLQAGRDINLASTTSTGSSTNGNYTTSQTRVDRVAGLYITGLQATAAGPASTQDSAAGLTLSAARDINARAADIRSTERVILSAGQDINLQTITTAQTNNFGAGDARTAPSTTSSGLIGIGVKPGATNASSDTNHRLSTQTQEVGSQISAGGDIILSAGQDINARAASAQANGALVAQAARDIQLQAGVATNDYDFAQRTSSSGFLSSTTTTEHTTLHSTNAIGSSLGGNTVQLQAGQDLRAQGVSVIADQDLALQAQRNITLEAAQNTSTSSHSTTKSESGLLIPFLIH